MPSGFQTWDEQGRLDLDLQTRLAGTSGIIITDSTHGGSAPAPPRQPGEFFYYVIPPIQAQGRQPQLQERDGRIYWYADTIGSTGQPAYTLYPCTCYVGWF